MKAKWKTEKGPVQFYFKGMNFFLHRIVTGDEKWRILKAKNHGLNQIDLESRDCSVLGGIKKA